MQPTNHHPSGFANMNRIDNTFATDYEIKKQRIYNKFCPLSMINIQYKEYYIKIDNNKC